MLKAEEKSNDFLKPQNVVGAQARLVNYQTFFKNIYAA
jgi:hypothetical protein